MTPDCAPVHSNAYCVDGEKRVLLYASVYDTAAKTKTDTAVERDKNNNITEAITHNSIQKININMYTLNPVIYSGIFNRFDDYDVM